MKKVLVTGAGGFVGRELVKELVRQGKQVVAIVRKMDEEWIEHKNVKAVLCDLKEIENLPRTVPDRDIDTCIHLAWAGTTGEARADYDLQLRNVQYTMKLVDAIGEMGVSRFVGAGTLAEKDVLNYHPVDGATPNAVSIYGIAKLSAHFMTKAECAKLGIDHIWCYISNTYGVGNRTGNFVNFACKKMLMKERAAFTAGEQTYDFVYVTDTARAIYAAALRGKKNTSYYLGSTKARKLKEYITLIRDTIDPSIHLYMGEIPFHGYPLGKQEYDCTKLVEDTGFQAEMPFEEGIQLSVEWLRKELGLKDKGY